MKILLVSQMYPGPDAPDHGVFVKGMADALEERGHELERAVLDDPRRGRRRYASLLREGCPRRPALPAGRRLRPLPRPDRPARGLRVARTARRDCSRPRRPQRRLDPRSPGCHPRRARRASALVAVSAYLREELEARVPEARGKTEVADSGVDLRLFSGADPRTAREELDWNGDGPAFVCIGTLDERKNVMRLARAFEHLGDGRLAFVGDGPLRDALEGRPGVRVVGRVPHDQVARWVAAADVVCQPSLVEPFGQALIEALASERSVLATRVGGPPEYVTQQAGVLIDPEDEDAIVAGLRAAAELPTPNPAARAAAEPHDVKRQAARLEAILERAARGRSA